MDIEDAKKMASLLEIKNELKEYDFEMRTLKDEVDIAIAGDGETTYLFIMLLPYRKKFSIRKRYIWKFKTLAYKFKAKPYILTYNVMTTIYPLHALNDAGDHFELDIEKAKGSMFSFGTIVSEELQERLAV
jgi:Holliday junction resolvase